MLDMMAQRYGQLPSKILQEATTFDMVVMDISITYQQYLKNKDNKDYVPQLPTVELLKLREQL